MANKKIYDIAYARSGDKGSNANIALFAHDMEGYQLLLNKVTADRIISFFHTLPIKHVDIFPVPNLLAINFVLHGVLGEGGSASLRIDSQGKALGQALLELQIED
jgi:hypothetical protein